MQDAVGDELVRDEHKFVTGRAVRQVARDLAPDAAEFIGPSLSEIRFRMKKLSHLDKT